MSSSGDLNVQSTVHSVDQGWLALAIKIGASVVVIIGLSLFYLFIQFRGLNNPSAMDQAQIARNIASGEGFTTDYIRPAAMGMVKRFQGTTGAQDLSRFPDFAQAPLLPLINSIPLGFIKDSWKMGPTDVVYAGDRVLAASSMLFFILSLVVFYFVFARLFDPKLAIVTCSAVLLTDLMWQFSLSGLPQMLVLFLFSLVCLTTLLAIDAQQNENLIALCGWVALTGLLIGLMTLAHGLCFWVFAGWAVFAALYFRPRGLIVLAAVAAFLLSVAPWLVRNYQVCGNPFGIAIYEAFYDDKPEESYQRAMSVSTTGSPVSFQGKFRANFNRQLESLFGMLGLNIAAGAFFLALLHPFRNRRTANFKWCIISMWLFAFIGMCIFRGSTVMSENQLHVIFIPIFAAFGIAFLFVLWNRLELNIELLRNIFIAVILFLCALPMLLNFVAGQKTRIQWPPYVPPFISILGDWFTTDEVICSDMPWAVAWYAQRTSLLMPESMRLFNRIHDYDETKQPVVGLYLTPVSGNQKLFSEIYKGPNADWAPLITRPPKTDGFPFTQYVALPIENECIIFADRDRWTQSRNTEP